MPPNRPEGRRSRRGARAAAGAGARQAGRSQAARLPLSAALRARPVGARAQPAGRRVEPRSRARGDGADLRRRGALRRQFATRCSTGKKSPMIFGQPDQWLALLIESLLAGRTRRARAIAAAARRAPSRRRPPRAATSTAGRSPGSPTPIRGWGRCSRRSSTAATTGCRSRALDQDRDRTAGGSARHGLDAGASAVRERRRVGGADSDAIPRLAAVARRPDRAGAQDDLGGVAPRRHRGSVSESSPPIPTRCR